MRMFSHLSKTFGVSILQWTISTVVNNSRKKSAPPKAHASVPPAPRIELPHTPRKDSAPYLSAIGSEWEAILFILRAYPNYSPLSSIPQIFFKLDFNLGDPCTFNAIAEVPSSSTPSSTYLLLAPV
ncbi:hypothetical protein V8E53_000772 [Lactarius tabidus]